MTKAARYVRVLWPIIFLVPLSWIAGKFCSWPAMDPLYHAIVWLHERLPAIVAFVALFSALAVAIKLAKVRSRFDTLLSLGSGVPADLRELFAYEAAQLAMVVPRIAYLDVPLKVCCTVVGGPAVLISRGFVEPLSIQERRLAVRHELLHVRQGDPQRGLLWHLALAALPVPDANRFERWLYDARERRTSDHAAEADPETYKRLLARSRERGDETSGALCSDATVMMSPVGLSAATFLAPAAGVALIVALLLSHALFSHDLPFLLAHHC